MNNEDKINKIIELLQSPDLDDYECCIEIAKVVGIYNYEREAHKTPHGYAIIVPHGFDTRELMENWKDYDITLKKDELLFLDMITNK